jgi:hypothetical protein
VASRSASGLDGTVATRRRLNAQALHSTVRTFDVATFGPLHTSGPLAQIVKDLTLIVTLAERGAVLVRSNGSDHSKRLVLYLRKYGVVIADCFLECHRVGDQI